MDWIRVNYKGFDIFDMGYRKEFFNNQMPENGQEIILTVKHNGIMFLCQDTCTYHDHRYFLAMTDWDEVVAWTAFPEYDENTWTSFDKAWPVPYSNVVIIFEDGSKLLLVHVTREVLEGHNFYRRIKAWINAPISYKIAEKNDLSPVYNLK